MAFKHEPNKGSIFINGKKEKEKHPDHEGSAFLPCPECGAANEYWISGWNNTLQNSGKAYIGFSFKIKDGLPSPTPPAPKLDPSHHLAPEGFVAKEPIPTPKKITDDEIPW